MTNKRHNNKTIYKMKFRLLKASLLMVFLIVLGTASFTLAQGNLNEIETDNAMITGQATKSPLLAGSLSLILPGAGQFYNGHTGKGIGVLGAAGVALFLIVDGSVDTAESVVFYDDNLDDGLGQVALGSIILAGAYAYSVVDAVKSANSINREAEHSQFGHLFELEQGDKVVGFDVTAIDRKPGVAFSLHF